MPNAWWSKDQSMLLSFGGAHHQVESKMVRWDVWLNQPESPEVDVWDSNPPPAQSSALPIDFNAPKCRIDIVQLC